MGKNWNRHGPSVRDVTLVIMDAKTSSCGLPDGRWVPSRSLGWGGMRLRLWAAWLVFTGRADALHYPGQDIQ